MKFPANNARIKRRAALDTAKKIGLEPHLETSMRRILKNIIKSFRVTYPASQETILPHRFYSDINAALREHYRRTKRVFLSSHRDEAAVKKAADHKKVDDAVNAEMDDYILKHSDKQTSMIIKTTQSDLDKAIQKAVADSMNTGKPINSSIIADAVAKDYTRKVNGRVKTIALTETQSIAEKTKEVELANLDDIEDLAGIDFSRVWVAILDNVTRDWHAEADGQTAAMGEPFIVMGEPLMYPGDPSGSAENICNCRCASVPIDSDDAKSIIIDIRGKSFTHLWLPENLSSFSHSHSCAHAA